MPQFLAHPLDGVYLKLERAKKHLVDFQTEVLAFNGSKPYSVRTEHNPKTSKWSVYAQIHQAIPTTWGLLVGDMVHNLRSALDHVAWEFALIHYRADPAHIPQPKNRIEFPIYWQLTAENKAKYRKKVDAFPPAARATVESLQPHTMGALAKANPLHLVNDLDAWDKHKRLNLMFGLASQVSYAFTLADGQVIRHSVPLLGLFGPKAFIAVEDGAKIIDVTPQMRVLGETVTLKAVNMDPSVTIQIVFGHETDARLNPAVETSEACVAAVEQCIKALKPFYP